MLDAPCYETVNSRRHKKVEHPKIMHTNSRRATLMPHTASRTARLHQLPKLTAQDDPRQDIVSVCSSNVGCRRRPV